LEYKEEIRSCRSTIGVVNIGGSIKTKEGLVTALDKLPVSNYNSRI